MLPIVVIVLLLTALVAAATFALMVYSVLREGPQPCGIPNRTWRWHPPLANSSELRSWAAEVAESVTRRFVGAARNRTTPTRLVAELLEGATFAINHVPHRDVEADERFCGRDSQPEIGVTAPEVLAIADRLRGDREVARRVHDAAAEGKPSSCPLRTAEGACASYPLRPLQCRARGVACHCSCDDAQGISTLEEVAFSVGTGAEDGLARGMEAAGLDARLYELNSALLVALETRDASERWARGEDVFGNCRLSV